MLKSKYIQILFLLALCASNSACSVKPPEQVNFSVKGSMGKDQAPKLEYSIDTHPIGEVESEIRKNEKTASKAAENKKPAAEKEAPPVNFGNSLSFQRGKYLPQQSSSGSGSGSNSGQNASMSAYAPDRLARAAVIKSYAPVQVVPIGLDAFCKTAWMNGLLHVRVALLGPEGNIKTFLQDYPSMKVTFRDDGGNQIQEYTIPASLVRRANANTNYGTPTFEYEGQVAMPLEVYEQFWQWTLEWE